MQHNLFISCSVDKLHPSFIAEFSSVNHAITQLYNNIYVIYKDPHIPQQDGGLLLSVSSLNKNIQDV